MGLPRRLAVRLGAQALLVSVFLILWWGPLLVRPEAGAQGGWVEGWWQEGVPTAASFSLMAGSCQDAAGLRAAPGPAQGQRLLSRGSHHPCPARARKWGLPIPAHQCCGGLLHTHKVGSCFCCPLASHVCLVIHSADGYGALAGWLASVPRVTVCSPSLHPPLPC